MNILKKIAPFCLLLETFSVHAQSLERSTIGTLGGNSTGGGSQLMYNMGEPATATLNGSSNTLTQGFEQSGVTVSPIAGVSPVCAGMMTSLTDATPGGIWSTNSTSVAVISNTGVVTGVAAGTAMITYSVSGSSVTAIVTVNALPVPATVAGPVLCNGGATGTATVMATGGMPPYSGIGTFTGLAAGVHTYTVRDANNCAAIATTTVTSAPVLTASLTSSGSVCGGSGGSASATVSGGTPGYSYLWSNGATTSIILGMPAGSYSVTVTDAHGCMTGGATSITAGERTVTVRLVSSTGAGIAGGTVQYYNGSWITMGTTDAAGYVCMSFPTPAFSTAFSTYFRVQYAGGTQQWSGVAVASSPVLIATTTNVSIALKDHTGAFITSAAGTVGYYPGTWATIGSTGSAGFVSKELLPGAYYFNMVYSNYTAQQNITIGAGPSQTVSFQTTLVRLNLLDHTGALITAEAGTAGYYSGGWYPVGSTGGTGSVALELLPGAGYYFNMNYHNYTQQQPVTVNSGPVQNVNFQTTLVTLNLLDHTGAPITAESGTGGYYSGGWYNMGSTSGTGKVALELLPGSGYYFNMNYHNYTQQQPVTVNSGPVQNVNFQTTLVTLNLLDHNGTPVTAESGTCAWGASASGTGGYYSGSWYSIGSTGSTGSVAMELLPGSGYYFNMNYHNYTQQQPVTVNVGPIQNVNFQTTLVTLNLLNHNGSPIISESGTGGYYSGGWYSMGSTGSTGKVAMELLPGSGYYFNMNYHNYTQQQAVTVTAGPLQNVNFQATLVTLVLLDHTGSPITTESGTGGYYAGGWYTMGSTAGTGGVSMEMLPGSGYYFNMNYHNYTQQQAVTVTSGPSQNVVFRTTLVTLKLFNHSGSLITAESGTGGYYTGGWYTIGGTGSTGTVGVELLPGSGYYFNMNYHNGTQQVGATTVNGDPWTQAVAFQTALVTVHYQRSSGTAISGGAIGYYSGGWYTLGTSDAGGNTAMEMLPVSYYYNAVATGVPLTQVGPFIDAAAGTPTHVIIAKSSGARTTTTDSSATTGVNTVTTTDLIKVYPNPTDGMLNIEIPVTYTQAEIMISDIAGRVIDSRVIADNKGEAIQFNLNNVTKGIYMIRVNAGETPSVTKVVVK